MSAYNLAISTCKDHLELIEYHKKYIAVFLYKVQSLENEGALSSDCI